MSVLEESSDVRMFNNAAFDKGGGLEVELCAEMKSLSESIEYDSSKENNDPLMRTSPAPFKTPVEIETSAFRGKTGARKGMKMIIKEKTPRDEVTVDKEIEQIETEMRRLSSKLDSLKREKLEMKKVRIRERRCSIVPAKYMEINSKQSSYSKSSLLHKSQDSKPTNNRRGVSLCPAEIYSASKQSQSRRQSCFFKLGEVDELKATKARGVMGTSASVSPKPPRSTVTKFDDSKKAITTIGSKKLVPKNDGNLSSVQPKKLFKESERSGTCTSGSASVNKPSKSGRVIPSRYNQSSIQTPDSVSTTKIQSLCKSESRVKKRWEIPAKRDVVVYMSDDREVDDREVDEQKSDSNPSMKIDQMGDVLRKIRTVRCVSESPRDSGAVKRVADLVGKKSFFADSGQTLSFVDEDAAEIEDVNNARS